MRKLPWLVSLMVVAALTSRTPARAPESTHKSAAVVNGEAIAMSDVEAILKARPVPGDRPTDAEYREMQREALDMLIDDVILRQFLRKSVPAVRPAEVSKKLGELKDALKAQGQTIEAYCRESGQTTDQIRDNLVTMLQRKAFLATHVDDAVARKYYDDNREFFDQVTVRVSHILLRLPAGTAPAEVEAARVKLRAVRQEIASGKLSFADAVKTHSECPSAAAGGDIGYFPRKGVVEESFARAAFGMKRGELSDVIQTSYGLHLIQLTDRKTGPTSDFNKIVDTVREFAGQEMLADIVAKERLSAKIESKFDEDQNSKQKPKVHRSLPRAH
jgi:peptidyl-prolyl cis-trans isomerase C